VYMAAQLLMRFRSPSEGLPQGLRSAHDASFLSPLARLVGLKYHPCYLVSGVLPTLFSVEPKESLQDLFDREDEVRKLREGLSRERLILVLGLRRIGKSSLVLATLSSTGHPFVYVDVRRAYDEVSRRVPAERLYEELRSSLLRLSVRERVLEALRRMGLGAVSLLMIDS